MNVFDTPKSLFEERMQNQATQLRRASAHPSTSSSNLTVNFPVVYEDVASNNSPSSSVATSTTNEIDLAASGQHRRRISNESIFFFYYKIDFN